MCVKASRRPPGIRRRYNLHRGGPLDDLMLPRFFPRFLETEKRLEQESGETADVRGKVGGPEGYGRIVQGARSENVDGKGDRKHTFAVSRTRGVGSTLSQRRRDGSVCGALNGE